MRTKISLLAAVTLFLACGAVSRVPAQDAPSAPKPTKPKVVNAYHLDFSFNELEGDKKINTRHYSMNLTSNDSNEIKIGSRVPVTAAVNSKEPGGVDTQFQYIDVGMNIWAQLRAIKDSDEQELVVRSEFSNIDVTPPSVGLKGDPLIREMKIGGSTLLVEGKPLVIASMDDPTSKRQFQLEVTVSRLR
jgi:hypothetical protein